MRTYFLNFAYFFSGQKFRHFLKKKKKWRKNEKKTGNKLFFRGGLTTINYYHSGSPLHRENRQNGQKICQGKHKEFGNFVKFWSNCKFPDSKDTGYCEML